MKIVQGKPSELTPYENAHPELIEHWFDQDIHTGSHKLFGSFLAVLAWVPGPLGPRLLHVHLGESE